jgi:hypothetical protein
MTSSLQRWLVTIANLAAFAVLACVIAYWGWRWFGPASYVAPAPTIEDPVRAIALSPPFGARSGAAPAAAPAPPASDPRLLGVLAEPDGRGHALFRMADNSARLVAAGEVLAGEARLVAVRPDGVTLRDGGGERVIALRGQPRETTRGAPSRSASVGAAGCTVPAGYKGPVVRLNAELVQGLMAQPESLRTIADARDGALVVRDEAGFAALLGLKKGDRVAQANGIALRAPEDIVFAVLRPLAASQLVRLVGSRAGEPRELVIVNAGACPG